MMKFAKNRDRWSLRSAKLVTVLLAFVALTVVSSEPSFGEQPVTSPKAFLGHDLGEDYYLCNYQELMAYWQKLDEESNRLKVVSIGLTAEGRQQLMGIVTSPENHAQLTRYREISRRMANAEGINEELARTLAKEGKAVVWIDGGLHASEVLCAQANMETMYRFLRDDDPETLRILDDVIILFVHANPDGMDLCSNWYMRNEDPEQRSLAGLPRLYQKYIGHDNNRDFFANTQAETRNMNYTMYIDWLPQIVYNHHQTGPSGTVLFCPPFRDPANYNVNPLVTNGIDAVGAAMMQRFLLEGKKGATSRSGASYSTWWNGGLRTTAYFHNMIGLLTETIGSPTPSRIRFRPDQQLPTADYLAPIEPQEWHFRQSVEYTVTANKGVLDYASRHREQLLYNIWYMGNEAIERGNRDSWTITPSMVKAAQERPRDDSDTERPAGAAGNRQDGNFPVAARQGGGRGNQGQDEQGQANQGRGNRGQQARGGQGRGQQGRGGRQGFGRGRGRGRGLTEEDFERMFRDPDKRDPRGFIIPASQTDFLTATKFVNTLMGTGVVVHQAKDDFEVNGKQYAAGSYVVKTAQAFRAHVMDMFEPQDHPDDFAYPGATPTAPYDIAGWTLAFSMGVEFDRVLDGFDGPFERLELLLPPPAGQVVNAEGAEGFFFDTRVNDAFLVANRLLAGGAEVHRLTAGASLGDRVLPPGTFYVANGDGVAEKLNGLAEEIGVSFMGTTEAPADLQPVNNVRIGLWDRTGGSMPSGWTRWILEQFEYPFDVVYSGDLDDENLRSKYDVLIFVTGALSDNRGRGVNTSNLVDFVQQGGTVLTIGSSTSLGYQMELPFADHLVQPAEDGEERSLGRSEFYIPGSLLRASVDNTQPLAWGLADEIDIMFYRNSPTFRLTDDVVSDASADDAANGDGKDGDGQDDGDQGNDQEDDQAAANERIAAVLSPVAWFDTDTPLRSGWAWGQEHLEGGISVIDARIGDGRLAMYGSEVLFRGQPHGTFKLVFNGITNANGAVADEPDADSAADDTDGAATDGGDGG